MHVPESDHELVQIARPSEVAETEHRLLCCLPSAGGSVRRPLPAMGVSCDDGPSAKDSRVSKPIAFVFLKYLIRSILHSRKHFELLSFYNMDTRLLKSCFGTYSEFILLDFMTDLLMVPFCQLMF